MFPDTLPGKDPADALALASRSIHVWAFDLDQPEFPLAQLAALLAPDEQVRAARFRFERDRRRYLVGRGVLRVLLGAYLREDPARLNFAYGAAGKPALQPRANCPELHFNLAHAGGRALVAMTRLASIGVDLENVREVEEMESIADRFFAAPESAALRLLPSHDKVRAFYRIWTRKEAVIKATGEGLSQPLDQFAVSITEDNPLELCWLSGAAAGPGWSLFNLDAGPDFVGALALRYPGASVPEFHWLPPGTLSWMLPPVLQPVVP